MERGSVRRQSRLCQRWHYCRTLSGIGSLRFVLSQSQWHCICCFFAYMCPVWAISRTPCCSGPLVHGDADFCLFILLCSDPLAIDFRILPFPACKGLFLVPGGYLRPSCQSTFPSRQSPAICIDPSQERESFSGLEKVHRKNPLRWAGAPSISRVQSSIILARRSSSRNSWSLSPFSFEYFPPLHSKS
jgi:hypothetical protein